MKILYIATKNKGKLNEYKQLLKSFTSQFRLEALPKEITSPEEHGNSFEENALIKATYYAKILNSYVLADDSGLCVDFLNGAPGIYSSRFAGSYSTDNANNELLLKKLVNQEQMSKRKAYFCCCITICKSDSLISQVTGQVSGYILEKKLGSYGFGYDPLFFYPKLGKTFAQMTNEQKNKISHRAVAIEKLLTQASVKAMIEG